MLSSVRSTCVGPLKGGLARSFFCHFSRLLVVKDYRNAPKVNKDIENIFSGAKWQGYSPGIAYVAELRAASSGAVCQCGEGAKAIFGMIKDKPLMADMAKDLYPVCLYLGQE